MTTPIKICGITRVEDALHAARCGAAAIGMIFVNTGRMVTESSAREICAALPPYVDRVGVFCDQSLDQIEAVLARVPLTRIQLHGGENHELAARLPGALTRALVHNDPQMALTMARWREARGDTQFLLDLPKNGLEYRPEEIWDVAAGLPPRSVTLAGRLDPDNVLSALERARPAAVDVARGVESAPGIKDPERVRAFCEAIRRHDAVAGDPS